MNFAVAERTTDYTRVGQVFCGTPGKKNTGLSAKFALVIMNI
jgi:hypothetical protein